MGRVSENFTVVILYNQQDNSKPREYRPLYDVGQRGAYAQPTTGLFDVLRQS